LRAGTSSGYPAPLSAREAYGVPVASSAAAPSTISAIASSVPPAGAAFAAATTEEEESPFEKDGENVQRVAEYAPEIADHLFREESALMPRPDYMEHQPDINSKMRAILIDWLVEVHMKYRLRHETLFLTVNLIDRYLACVPVMRRRLQLVGVVAMFVAAKFEEIDPPTASDFAYITDNSFTRDDVVIMECNMLSSLGFQIVVPTAAHFLDRFQRANRCDDVHREVAQYLLELALLDLHATQHAPSHLVAAALLLSNELLGRHPVWPMAMVQHSRRQEHTLRACAEDLRALLLEAPGASLQAVRKKYLRQQHHSVAKILHNATGSAPAPAVSLSAARAGA
jgi:cyclin B